MTMEYFNGDYLNNNYNPSYGTNGLNELYNGQITSSVWGRMDGNPVAKYDYLFGDVRKKQVILFY